MVEAALPSARVVDVRHVIDNARLGPVQIGTMAFVFIAQMVDGFDIQAIAFAAPTLMKLWGITRAEFGPILASAFLGMALGAMILGTIGDKYGRKTALIGSSLIIAVGAMASAFAGSPHEMMVCRFIAGIGLGGVQPNAAALIFEFAPRRLRQLVTAISLVGLPLGGLLGAALSQWLIPAYGWSSLFIVGGVAPILLALVMYLWLLESPSYLQAQTHRVGELSQLLSRLDKNSSYSIDQQYSNGDMRTAKKGSIAPMFAQEYRMDTMMLWLIFFSSIFSIYFFSSWLPTVIMAANLPMSVALSGSLYFNLGGIFGTIFSGAIVDRYGSRYTLAILTAAAILVLAAIGANTVFTGGGAITSLMWTVAAAGACLNAVAITMFSVAANIYPPHFRTTGVGWAVSISRGGSIFSSFVGSMLFALGMTPNSFFYVIAAFLVTPLVGVLLLRRHIPSAGRRGDLGRADAS